MADYRDMVIETLADSEATLLARVVELIAEREAYRMVAQQAIHHCHAQYVQLTALRAGHERLYGEYRLLREKGLAHVLEAL